MNNLVEYRAQLVAKLNTVDEILMEMGVKAKPLGTVHSEPSGTKLSASAKRKISKAKKAWWAKKRDGATHK